MKIIDQYGRTLTWIAVYMRYRCEERAECDSLDEAVGFLWGGLDNGDLSPVAVIEPEGHIIERPELDKMFDDRDRKIYGED